MLRQVVLPFVPWVSLSSRCAVSACGGALRRSGRIAHYVMRACFWRLRASSTLSPRNADAEGENEHAKATAESD